MNKKIIIYDKHIEFLHKSKQPNISSDSPPIFRSGLVIGAHANINQHSTNSDKNTSQQSSKDMPSNTLDNFSNDDVSQAFSQVDHHSDLSIDDFLIPTPPPLPKEPLTKPSPILTKTFQERLSRTLETEQQLKTLEERGLFNSERNTLTGPFYKLLAKVKAPSEMITINVSEESLTNPTYCLGLLAVHDLNNDIILLSGIQNHVVVIYTIVDGYKIVAGYLTSEKQKDHIPLSEKQPFPRDDGKPSENPQLFKLLPPFIIKGNDITPLPAETEFYGNFYLQKKEVKDILQKVFEEITPKLSVPISVYNGQGITSQDIALVLNEQEKEAQLQTKNLFQEYEKRRKQQGEDKSNEWLDKLERNNTQVYPYVKKLVDAKYYNEK